MNPDNTPPKTVYVMENADKSRRIELNATEEALEIWKRNGWVCVGFYEPYQPYRMPDSLTNVTNRT